MRISRVNDLPRQAAEEAQAASVEQTKADVDYIAMMTGVIIDDEEAGTDE
jgi:hypothetical protein